MNPVHILPNGVKIINCTPHPLHFTTNGNDVIVVPAAPRELVLHGHIAEVEELHHAASWCEVKIEKHPTEAGQTLVKHLRRCYPEAIIIASMIACEAYPGQVHNMVPFPGFERRPPAEKRSRIDRFTCF